MADNEKNSTEKKLVAGSSNHVEQTRNLVMGDQAAGNIDKSTIINYPQNLTPLQKLAFELKQSIDNDPEIKGFIDELNHFTIDVTKGEVKGLENKLNAGGRIYLYDQAVYSKEQFTKKLFKYQYSLKAQQLFLHSLAKIKTKFRYVIKPMIKSAKGTAEVDKTIYDNILNELYNEIGGLGLDLSMIEIEGMLYFLAGNCHIDWSK